MRFNDILAEFFLCVYEFIVYDFCCSLTGVVRVYFYILPFMNMLFVDLKY